MSHSFAFAAAHPPELAPAPADPALAAQDWERWRDRDPSIAAALTGQVGDHIRRWLVAIFGNAPYLTRLVHREPQTVLDVLDRGPNRTLAELLDGLNRENGETSRAAIAAELRAAKRRAALVVAMADIAGLWSLAEIMRNWSEFAAATLSAALRHLLTEAAARGHLILADPQQPEHGSGVIILGMGKLGAFELNYSSDIDLIILYDGEHVRSPDVSGLQPVMTRLARDLTKLLEERTADGYVFRTDLNLRPDPRSMPPAVSVAAAETYYASVGQNWERAALIKARAVAGDLEAGAAFLHRLAPFLWRKHLDFAAIRDIQSIKRQIDVRQGHTNEALFGHNVKLGYGGIREIEFFAQTQQLIWGGRLPAVRRRGTIEALNALAAARRITASAALVLERAYEFLRRIEHRLQMLEDNHTHSLPADAVGLARFAVFAGFPDADGLIEALRDVLATVRGHFRELFHDAESLASEGSLVFTGFEDDEETLATLARMGFGAPKRVAETIRGWHHGLIRATRSARARELLTELIPRILRVLAETADPDIAFARFDTFLSHLPAGVQLFSLFERHPEILNLVAEIMGEAPVLADQLARRPLLLDAVLDGNFYGLLPDDVDLAAVQLRGEVGEQVARLSNYEDALNLARRWTRDGRFQIGVQVLQGRIDGARAGRDFTLIAEAAIAALVPEVERDFARAHGRFGGGRFVVLGLGKLGGREMNALSDLDLIFIYDAPPEVEASDGKRALPPTSYFARLGQRVINALAAPTAEGALYEVDMRLRPLGNAGPLASSLEAFRRYHEEQAWTWERMALTRARVVAGDDSLKTAVEAAIGIALTRPPDRDQLLADVAAMRHRMLHARPAPPKPWDCKHRRGALIDLEFIAQYLELLHGPISPELIHGNTAEALRRLIHAGVLDPKAGQICLDALAFWHQLQQMLRVCLGKVESEDVAPELLDRALTRATGLADRDAQIARLDDTASAVLAIYDRLIEKPAATLSAETPQREGPAE